MGQLLVVFTPAISLATPSFQQSFLLLPGGVGRNLLLRQFVISSSGDKKDPPPTFDGEYEENLAIHPVNVACPPITCPWALKTHSFWLLLLPHPP